MRGFGPAFLLLALACGDPSISDVSSRRGVIEGTVVYPNGAARGNVYVFLYSKADLPPPTGFGRPLGFIAVPRESLFQDAPAGQRSTFSTRFAFPSVPEGSFELRAFLDADADFNPSYELLAQPTEGDVVGGFFDPSGRFATVEVRAGEVNANRVIVTLARELPVERPGFMHASATGFEVPLAAPQSLVLDAAAFRRGRVEMSPEKSRFLVQFVGISEEGRPLDANGDHLPDIYPQVYLRRIEAGTSTRAVLVPLINNPLPFLDELSAEGFALSDRLELIVPPLAVEIDRGETRRLPNIPAGDYETIVFSGTGQTWRVPNDLATLFPGEPEPSQSVVVRMSEGAPLPPGRIAGRLLVPGASQAAETYVFAFAEASPPPPAGTGRPSGLVALSRASLLESAGGLEARFEIGGLEEGRYHLVALFDGNDSFSPLVESLAEPDAGDFVGRSMQPVATGSDDIEIVLDARLPFDRPGFSFAPDLVIPSFELSRASLASNSEPLLSVRPQLNQFAVRLRASDETGDNLPELYPRVLLTLLEDTPDPRTALDQSPLVVVPAFVDPMPFLTALDAGEAARVTDVLPFIIPPVALESGQLRAGIPSGRYRVTLIAETGQTWRVPNASALTLGRDGTEREDLSQARFIRAEPGARANGRIEGQVTVPGLLTPGASVLVLAFDEQEPPPPAGAGRPVSSARLAGPALSTGVASYALSGLASGRYLVRAFIDRNADFVPWYDTHNQPTRGDVPGGYFEDGILTAVAVDGLGPATSGVDVTFVEAATYEHDRPLFELPADLELQSAGPPLDLTLSALASSSAILRAEGSFPIQWVDLDGDRIADDVNGDGAPDVFPLVLAERLDDADPEGLTLASPGERLFGVVNPAQFVGLGFPAQDTTQTSSVVESTRLNVIIPPISQKDGGEVGPPTPGLYRVSLINHRGQTWTVPSILQRADGDALQAGQARGLRVR